MIERLASLAKVRRCTVSASIGTFYTFFIELVIAWITIKDLFFHTIGVLEDEAFLTDAYIITVIIAVIRTINALAIHFYLEVLTLRLASFCVGISFIRLETLAFIIECCLVSVAVNASIILLYLIPSTATFFSIEFQISRTIVASIAKDIAT